MPSVLKNDFNNELPPDTINNKGGDIIIEDSDTISKPVNCIDLKLEKCQ